VRPVGGAGDAFAVGGAEVELHRETAFADAGMLFEGVAVLQFHLSFRCVVDVGEIEVTAA
jgi:hypothetical protein